MICCNIATGVSSLLHDAGCTQLLIGLEAPGRRGLEGLETKANWKAGRADDYLDAIARIQRHGVTVNGCFILGLDGQTPESFDEVIEFVRPATVNIEPAPFWD